MAFNSEPPARDRILFTAHDLLYHHGIRATGIDRVIAEAGVTKVTFYRHFPSKNDLIRAYLDHRHQHWLAWFKETLERHGGNARGLAPTLAEWFRSEEFRGCAFINTVGELARDLPEVIDIARRHKQDMSRAISELLPASVDRDEMSTTLAVAIDGAIVRAQYDATPDDALNTVAKIVAALIG